jgi:hypothetical protein
MFGNRRTFIARDVRAGCYQCHNGEAHWIGKNAQGVAARHTDATGHRTWVEVMMSIAYAAPDDDMDGQHPVK